MKIADTRLKKALLIVTGSIILTVMLVIILISPIAKYLVEKYAGKYLGRQISMSWIYVNPFTGYVHISNLKIYESKTLPSLTSTDSIFFSANGVSANFAMLKLLFKTIEIEKITLDHPKGIIIQNSRELNFTDWIILFTPKKSRPSPSPVRFNIFNITIKNGEFSYCEQLSPFKYFIKAVNLESAGKLWDADTLSVKYSFHSGPGEGSANGNFTINFKKLDYRLSIIVHKYDLKFLEQYLKVLSNYGTLKANLDSDFKASGNFKDRETLIAKGLLVFNDFHCGKNPDDDYAACDKLALQIVELSPKNHVYLFDSLSLIHPYFKYERYDYLDNLQMMFGKNGTNLSAAKADPGRFNLILTIAEYIKGLAQNFFQSDYKINRLAIYNGDFHFNDFAISEKFSTSLNPLYFLADSINKNKKRVNVSLRSVVHPYGDISVTLSINPKDKGDYDMHYHLQKVAASMFNPYLITYSSFPLERGSLDINGFWKVRGGVIQSVNHLVIIDPRISRRLRNKDKTWLPMPLIMSLIRERGNVIDYEIPITGNINNPKFHLHDVLTDLIENIFVKPATGPYRMQVKNLEAEIEKSLTLKWEMRQSSLFPDQEKFVDRMVTFLNDNPDASISVYPNEYEEKEKEYIRFFEAKKKYFLSSTKSTDLLLSEDDSLLIDKMSVKDPVFVKYLNKQLNDTMLYTIQEKCSNFIGSDIISARLKQLNKEREVSFMSHFKIKTTANRVIFNSGENIIPFNGFSFYKISYHGEFPADLIKAYRKMKELNNEAPREKYKKERRKNKSVLSDIQKL